MIRAADSESRLAERDHALESEELGLLLPTNARAFIARFKDELARLTRHAELRVRRSELLERVFDELRQYGACMDRYERRERIGQGAMGEVFRVHDRSLHRDEALKRLRNGPGGAPEPARQVRFLQEAQIVAQLDHPNIPTVHDIGIDTAGRLFFTMPLIVGKSLASVLDDLPLETHAWESAPVLEGLLQAARAIAHAHERGVIHRDLKPTNLMLGRFGAMQVVDWGLARVFEESAADGGGAPALSRAADRDSPDRAAFETVDGSALGTPFYMPPEQADADRARIGPASDVYALGAILYELLTASPPYLDLVGERPTAHEVVARVQAQAPTPLRRLAPAAPAELVAVCERAMQREPAGRFPSARAFVEDLEAYLAGRVVRSYECGAWPELRKWILRNRTLAATLLLTFTIAVLGAAGVLTVQARREADARRQVAEIWRLSALQEAELLERSAVELWPARATRLADLEAWRDDARALLDAVADFEQQRATVAAGATRALDGSLDFPDSHQAWLHHQLGTVVDALHEFGDPVHGPLFGDSERFGPSVSRRIEWASAEVRRLADPAFQRAWSAATNVIAASPRYGGIRLSREGDLLPLGENRAGLWEFAVLSTGAAPEPGDGSRRVDPQTAVVLVLIPGGAFTMGSQKDDPDAPNWSRHAPPKERAPHRVELAPYFVSKYELTRAQAARIGGFSTMPFAPDEATLPAASLDWKEAARMLGNVDLELPTEAQLERAARAGSETTWWTGHDPEELHGRENVSFARVSSEVAARFEALYGFAPTEAAGSPLPVDHGAENPFGLLQVHGNVREWCRDAFGSYDDPVALGDGERLVERPWTYRVCRGGSFGGAPYHARAARRDERAADQRGEDCGVRPVRRARLQ